MSTGSLKVIVTGAAGGIGTAVVEYFTRRGASVAALTHEAPLSAVAAPAARLVCDVRSRSEVNQAFDAAAAALGGLDALIHTAGAETYAAAADIDEAGLRAMVEVNLNGTVWVNQAAYRLMRGCGGGSIVNFASISGIRGFPRVGAYAAAKGAVSAWTRIAAPAWGHNAVRVNAVAPVMLTGLSRAHRATLSAEELEREKARVRDVLDIADDFGDPLHDLAPVLWFLAGPDAGFITGQCLPVDGGWVKVGS
jgi:3-oxoacyl-[acyl-carrier protein] reductase